MKKIGPRSLGILLLAIPLAVVVGAYVATKATPPPVEIVHRPEARPPILIGEDKDFTKVGVGSGCECVREGSGTERDPYVISEWIVNASESDGVVVFGTNSYFTIKGVRIQGKGLSTGISLDRVENGKVEDSFIVNNFIAVYAFRSHNLEFVNNTLEENEYGIHLESSNSNRISSNHFNQIGQVAIFVRGQQNSVMENVVRGAFGGINIDGTAGGADDNVVVQNSIMDTTTYGIGVWRAARTLVRSNIVTQNEGLGIVLTEGSFYNSVEANVVTENAGGGILVSDRSSQNTIMNNTARGNGDGVRLFDLADTSSGNIWKNNTYDTKTPDTLE